MGVGWISFVVAVLLFMGLVAAIRRGILDTKYSIIWFLTCVGLGILSSSRALIAYIADTFSVHYAPSIFFFFGLLFLLIIVFDLTRRISKMNNQIITLIQEQALLKQKYEHGAKKK